VTSSKDPREEAERLIATLLGGASMAAEGLNGFATGSPECCVCPVCRAIAAAREPDPEIAERLASGAADLASGLAGVLRAFSRAAGGGSGGGSAPAGDPWQTATRAADTASAPASSAPSPPASGATAPAPGATAPAPPPSPVRPKPMAKKAVKPKTPPPPAADPEE
jgi:hypothetical protein